MNIEKLISISDNEPVVKNNLLLSGQVSYNLGLNQIIGPQKKVLYNAMGPDVSTVLYLTDPEEVIGIEQSMMEAGKLQKLIEESWDTLEYEVDKHDLKRTFSCMSDKEARDLYLIQLGHRKKYGYWDYGELENWGRERLMALELKKLGIKKEDIEIKKESFNKFTLTFPWKHPNSEEKSRTIFYNQHSTLDEIPIPKMDAFYQKALPYWDFSLRYVGFIKKKINSKGNVLLGYWHTEGQERNNKNFKKQSKINLGRKFKEIDDDELVKLINCTRQMGYYGNRLHGFSRK